MEPSAATTLAAQLQWGEYDRVLTSDPAKRHIQRFADSLHEGVVSSSSSPSSSPNDDDGNDNAAKLVVGLAALNAFLQTNVTGPALADAARVEAMFTAAASRAGGTLASLRRLCLTSLDVDGVAAYPYVSNVELFCLARHILLSSGGGSPDDDDDTAAVLAGAGRSSRLSLAWLRLRVHAWHYRLLTQPSLGAGSAYNKSSQWSDVSSLEELIEAGLNAVEEAVLRDGTVEDKVLFLVEKANTCIMLGQDVRARAALKQAAELNGFSYALSGALGKRTRFQQKSTSQLVVLAKSNAIAGHDTTKGDSGAAEGPQAVPEALALNDDTLLEQLEFTKETAEQSTTPNGIPPELEDLSPDEQPQLSPLDQIILLTEATLKDAFSPADSLTSEEILPFAVRVISDKSTNWQIYTQALLVRSRIEVHRSRTVERGVLQMQAVVDQVIVDTTAPSADVAPSSTNGAIDEVQSSTVPAIKVCGPDEEPGPTVNNAQPAPRDKPTTFFPAARQTETAPAQVRLEYVHALASAPRWHLESELAHSWIGVGAFVSALEIFKRLRLWAEVALCLAGSASADDEGGRGSGPEENARAVLRWRLFRRTSDTTATVPDKEADAPEDDDNDDNIDIEDLKAADYAGPERNPPPANAPRLFCILGDIEDEPAHYERAWEVSGHRFARAQRSLGEHHLRRRDWAGAREAYRRAVAVNRLSPELWNRLGDISLRLGDFSDAAEAFGRAIASADDGVGGEDARTWSNLGTALYSMYVERVGEVEKEREDRKKRTDDDDDDNNEPPTTDAGEDGEEPGEQRQVDSPRKQDPSTLLSQSLAAFKRGASISNDNWRIWDNVITLAARVRPPRVADMILGLWHVIRIRATEDALDADVLRTLVSGAVLSRPRPDIQGDDQGPAAAVAVVDLPRGSPEKAVCDLLETAVAPLITSRADLWSLISRARAWRRDGAGAVDASERAWRAAMAGAGVGVSAALLSSPSSSDGGKSKNWLEDKGAWEDVVERTDELVSALENYGPDVAAVGARWKAKARSAVRSVMGKAREAWEGTEGWERLGAMLEGLR